MPCTILLVDDHAPEAVHEARMLERYGFRVKIVGKGKEAAAAVEAEESIALVLMDLELAGEMDAAAAAERILAVRQLPIVFLTDRSEPEYLQQAEELTGDGIVQRSAGEFFILQAVKTARRLFSAHAAGQQENTRRDDAEDIRFLAETAYTFIDTEGEDALFRYIGESLQRLNPDAYIVINSFDSSNGVVTTKELFGFGNVMNALLSILGFDPRGKQYRIDSHIYALTSARVEKMPGGIHKLTFGEVPRPVARSAEKLLGIEHIYLIAFMVDREIYATAALLFPGRRELQNAETVETFVKQASIALKRQYTERQLRESEERYRLLAEHSTDVIAHFDGHMNARYLSPSVEELTGYSPPELKNESIFHLVHPEDLTGVRSRIEQSIREGAAKAAHIFRLRTKSGALRWVESKATFRYEKSGELADIILNTRDITERKQLNEKFSTYIDYAPHGLIVADTCGNIEEVNRATTHITNYPQQELVHMNVADLAAPDTAPFIAGYLRTVREQGSIHLDLSVQRKDGRKIWLSISAVTIEQEKLLIFGVDITERKETERKNEERKRYLDAILQANPNAILTLDPEDRIGEWNRGAEQLFGYTKDEAVGTRLEELISGQEEAAAEEIRAHVRRLGKGGALEPVEVKRYTKQGEALSVIAAAAPIFVDSAYHGIAVSYTDIRELKRKEAEVQRLLGEKEQLLREVHHRIKNHMNTIASILSLRKSNVSDPHTGEVLEEIRSKISLMQSIYQTLYTGEEVGSIRISSFLKPLIRDIRATYVLDQEIRIEQQVEDVEITSKQSLPVGIIITELLANALKYAFPGRSCGTVSLAIERDAEGLLRIRVSDDGAGMPEEVLREGKYGFGLTLVDGYAGQFDGQLQIENTAFGSAVTVSLQLE